MENTIGVKKILYKVATYADRLKNISSSCRRKPGSILDYSENSPIRELIILKEGTIEVVLHIATDTTDAFGRNLTMICSQNSDFLFFNLL